ncbi:MAG: hypothetical protein M1838_005801 [Thelocarpon superellum]|nr:MAG: hypothetical protein M1838_005801 [Thelocarpon superellum]
MAGALEVLDLAVKAPAIPGKLQASVQSTGSFQEQMDLLNATRQTATAMIDLVLNVAGNMTEVAFNKTIWDLYFANSNSSHVREIYQMMRDSPFEAHCSACETGLWYNDTIIPVGAFCAPLFFAAPKSDYDDMVCNTPTGSSSWGPWTRSQWVLQWLAESALTAHPPAPPPPVNEWTMESQHRSGLFYVPQDTVVSAGKYSFDYFKGLKRNEGEVVPFAYWAYAQELWAYNSTQCQNGSHPVTNHR